MPIDRRRRRGTEDRPAGGNRGGPGAARQAPAQGHGAYGQNPVQGLGAGGLVPAHQPLVSKNWRIVWKNCFLERILFGHTSSLERFEGSWETVSSFPKAFGLGIQLYWDSYWSIFKPRVIYGFSFSQFISLWICSDIGFLISFASENVWIFIWLIIWSPNIFRNSLSQI